VYRGKGILHIADDSRRIFHLVGDRCVVTVGPPWSPEEVPKTELVLIGWRLDEEALRGRLAACLKGGPTVERSRIQLSAEAAGPRSGDKDLRA